MFNGTSSFVGGLLGLLASAIFEGLENLFLLFLLRAIVRRDWVAVLLFAIVSAINVSFAPITEWIVVPFTLLAGLLVATILFRAGLVAIIAQAYISFLLALSPMTLNTSAWYASLGYVVFAVIAGIAFYGFKISLGGRAVLAPIED